MTASIRPYEAQWGYPVKSGTLLDDGFRTIYAEIICHGEALLGLDFSDAPLLNITRAFEAHAGEANHAELLTWFVATQYWRLSSLSPTERQLLPRWWWELTLSTIQTGPRFEALAHVSAESFEQAVEEWVAKPNGISMAMIDYWRKKRSDALGQIPTATFRSLYDA